MANLETINERGLFYISMFIADVVRNDGEDEREGHGMWIHNTWISPETCYWLHQFLKEVDKIEYSNEEIERLKNGTNHPESL